MKMLHNKNLTIALIAASSALFFSLSNSVLGYQDPTQLERGKVYRISRSTILFPDKSIAPDLEALNKAKKVPNEGTIKVLKAVKEKTRTVYYVLGRGRRGDVVGKGWVTSEHLVGQSLDVVTKRSGKASNRDVMRLMGNIWGRGSVR